MLEVERDWKTKHGNRALCVDGCLNHRCGYVEVPNDHWLFKRDYSGKLEGVGVDLLANEQVGKRGAIDLLILSGGGGVRVVDLFDVHGSLTFSGVPLGADGGFWFGFDCGHCDDTREICNEEYVVQECENLSEQLMVRWSKPIDAALPAPLTAEHSGE